MKIRKIEAEAEELALKELENFIADRGGEFVFSDGRFFVNSQYQLVYLIKLYEKNGYYYLDCSDENGIIYQEDLASLCLADMVKLADEIEEEGY